MEIKDYISSGAIESAVLGVASQKDAKAADCLRKIYPEVQQEWEEVEQTIEMIAVAHAIQPENDIKAALMSKIRSTPQEKVSLENSNRSEETPIIPLNTAVDTVPVFNIWKISAAASVVLILVSFILFFNSSRKNSILSAKIEQMNLENEKNTLVLTAMKNEMEHNKAIQSVLTSPGTSRVFMKGTQMEPEAGVDVMWCAKTNKAVLMAETITPPPSNMQYQLWAIADGKPVSLGVFNHDELMNITDPFDVALKNISAFAITLEKKGGSEIPHLDKMVVMGAVNA